MDKLPQRDDLIYKEIEEFEDYELTNCVAYEMAIRNKIVKKLIKEISDIPMYFDEYEENYYPEEYYELERELEVYLIDTFIIRDIEDSFEKYVKNEHNDVFNIIISINLKIFIKNEEVEEKTLEEINKLRNSLKKIYYENIEKYKIEYRANNFNIDKIHNNSKPLFIELLNDGQGRIIRKEQPKKAIIENPNFMKFSRPRLKIKIDCDKSIDLKINLNLPKEELIAYISKIKDDFDKDNSIIKTPLELLGEILENENIDIKNLPKRDIKKIYADMFFIYDYFIFQDKKYKNEREKLKNELEIKIKEINKKWDYDKSDKKAEVEEQKNDYKTNKQKYSKEQIIDELMKELKFNRTKVNDYLKIMRMFIDDLEYKKLLTGGLKLY
ncbi:hypothetical protein [Aliarcobacter butzleri]|uniref:Uncharacterized protein n=1 Tax=Aliarcobacter butzleri TaxID=28197 RepID=A0AAW7Q139_9BACT|nr:hypothetical protein [Aliarcobacter butzleri]MDN5113095.1 hypothetical protein [Aliarcobacter butzleri]